jgi:hypothetical protein
LVTEVTNLSIEDAVRYDLAFLAIFGIATLPVARRQFERTHSGESLQNAES